MLALGMMRLLSCACHCSAAGQPACWAQWAEVSAEYFGKIQATLIEMLLVMMSACMSASCTPLALMMSRLVQHLHHAKRLPFNLWFHGDLPFQAGNCRPVHMADAQLIEFLGVTSFVSKHSQCQSPHTLRGGLSDILGFSAASQSRPCDCCAELGDPSEKRFSQPSPAGAHGNVWLGLLKFACL